MFIQKKYLFPRLPVKFAAFIFLLLKLSAASAQCPPNIDFENGNFDGWTLYSGSVQVQNGENVITLSPTTLDGYHAMLSAVPGNGLDRFGDFPKNCPNGSGHSIQLGDETPGAMADGVSYDFTIPVGTNLFAITYYYAVVYQNPSHAPQEQPRMEVEVSNLTDNDVLQCSSFTFVAGGGLPGFFTSPHNSGVLCRDWSANTINLDNMGGKTIRLFFKVADCTPGAHFGYAYIDVETRCDSNFPGASFCPGDTSVDVTAPIGYQTYDWHYQGSSQLLGTQQTLHLTPAPASGTTLAVDLSPYPGYGCMTTLTANLTADLVVNADAGPDKETCTGPTVQIGVAPQAGVKYKWSPPTGVSDPNISSPIVTVTGNATYTLTATSPGGGCTDVDQVNVSKGIFDTTLTLTGSTGYCIGSVQNSVLSVQPADNIQWYKDGAAIPGATQTSYTITGSGDYYAQLTSNSGCVKTTATKRINAYPQPHAIFSADNTFSCSPKDSIIFHNASTVAAGALQYSWSFGDGALSSDSLPFHRYGFPGIYAVKLQATGGGGCTSDTTVMVTIKPGADPEFSVQSSCINLPVALQNNTSAPGATVVNYLWDFGNASTSVLQNPALSYAAAGNYVIKLSASTPQCPQLMVKTHTVKIDAPAAGIRYADVDAVINYPQQLEARNIGNHVLWDPPTSLSNTRIYKPVFKGELPQLYTITLITTSGCITTDTVFVKPVKKIEIYVPTGFTPNGDGLNDRLKPLLYGFKKINYFEIYNRAGQLLFRTETDGPGWDGTVNGVRQDMQTVVWIISAEDVDGKVHRAKGTTIILR